MKLLKILLFILTIGISGSIGYYSYLFIAPVSEGIGSVYEGIVIGGKITDSIGNYNNETVYLTKLAYSQTKSLFTKDPSQAQKIEEERAKEIQEKELAALQALKNVEMIRKSITIIPYILSSILGILTFFLLSSRLFRLKSYLISAREYFSD